MVSRKTSMPLKSADHSVRSHRMRLSIQSPKGMSGKGFQM